MRCPRCHDDHPPEDFIGKLGKPVKSCKVCRAIALKALTAWRKKMTENQKQKTRDYGRKYYRENKARLRGYQQQYQLKYRMATNPIAKRRVTHDTYTRSDLMHLSPEKLQIAGNRILDGSRQITA